MRRLIAALCLAFSMSSHASSVISEISDLWGTAGEDGWGVNMVLQKDVAFATFYLYDVNRNPTWFTAVLQFSPGYVFSGNLYADRGPPFAGPFDPSTVVERQAGTATFTVTDLDHGTLTYTIDGVTVTKALQRLTFRLEDLSGAYVGGASVRTSNCTPASLNGLSETSGVITVVQSGTAFSMSATNTTQGTCTFNGTYSQFGKIGEIHGTYSCTTGEAGTFDLIEVIASIAGITARASGQNQSCTWTGTFGGITRAQ